MGITEYRQMPKWTWQDLKSLGSLLHSSSLTDVTETTWGTAHDEFEAVNFLSKSIDAHCTEASRAEYLKTGLCHGTSNLDNCPEFFLDSYLHVYTQLQELSTQLNGQRPRIYCRCTRGNCLNCKCKKKGQKCSIYCHGGHTQKNLDCRNHKQHGFDWEHEAKIIRWKQKQNNDNK